MLNPVKHHTVLIQALRDFFTDPFLCPVLGFKGGTAAHLFYGLQRFSVDLDFDLLEPGVEKEVANRMGTVLKPYGIIKDQFIKRHSFYFVLSYEAKHHNMLLLTPSFPLSKFREGDAKTIMISPPSLLVERGTGGE